MAVKATKLEATRERLKAAAAVPYAYRRGLHKDHDQHGVKASWGPANRA